MKTFILILAILFHIKVNSQDSLKFSYAFESWNDVVNNVHGGIKKGTVYRGLFAFDPSIEYGSFGFNNSFCYSLGKSPSKELVGDFQVLSNIDSDVDFFIFESYFYYMLKEKLKIKIGIINMNEEFVYCEKGADLLINSSFGIPSQITTNSPVSVYPITSFGTNLIFEVNNNNALKVGIYDGFPKTLTQSNLITGIHFKDGIFTISEYQRLFNKLQFKVGFFHHTGTLKIKSEAERVLPHNGIYSIVSGNVCRISNNQISSFLQFSHSLYNETNHNFYIGAGTSIQFNNDDDKVNQLILGIAHAGKRKFSEGETVYELSYIRQFGQYLFVQPDVQYIVNPLGYIKPLPNALTLNLRLLIIFER